MCTLLRIGLIEEYQEMQKQKEQYERYKTKLVALDSQIRLLEEILRRMEIGFDSSDRDLENLKDEFHKDYEEWRSENN